jgi:hypothetical protein
MRFGSNLLRDSENLQGGLATEFAVLRDLLRLQPSLRHANSVEEYSWRTRTQLPILLGELGTQLPILLGDSTNFREIFTP